MPLTDPHRATVREKLRPVIDDDEALDALMTQLPASPSDDPATKTDLAALEARLEARIEASLSAMEARLTTMVHDSQTKLMAILLSFTTAYLAIVVGAVIAFA